MPGTKQSTDISNQSNLTTTFHIRYQNPLKDMEIKVQLVYYGMKLKFKFKLKLWIRIE